MTGEPPFEVGAFHETVALVLEAAATTATGLLGVVGVPRSPTTTLEVGSDIGLVPTWFLAWITN